MKKPELGNMIQLILSHRIIITNTNIHQASQTDHHGEIWSVTAVNWNVVLVVLQRHKTTKTRSETSHLSYLSHHCPVSQ